MRVLCTGVLGFLGSRLAAVLREREHDVIGVDRDDGDLIDPAVAGHLIGSYSPSVVVHLAANPGRVFGERDPEDTVLTNTVATVNVARACAEVGARLVYVSTSEVYGTACDARNDPIPQFQPLATEKTPLGEPRNIYGASKAWGEQAARLYAPDGLTIIRPTMPYGPGMATGEGRAALPSMIAAFLRGEPYEVHAGTMRSWCYVEDLVRGMADVVEKGSCRWDEPHCGRGVFNVGRDDDLLPMIHVAMLVCDVIGVSRDLVRVVEPDETITKIKDISVARLRSLGWRPTVDLVEGIELTAASLR